MKKVFTGILKFFENIFSFFLAILATVASIICYLPFRILFPTRIKGGKNLRKFSRCGKLFSCNHYSNFDVVLLNVLLFPITFTRKYLSKKELGENVFSRVPLKGFGAIFIDRKRTDLQAMKQSITYLKKNGKLVIFPEGTRNKTGSEEMQAMHSGIAYFASKSNSCIVPMMLMHRIKPFRKNTLIVGEPFFIDEQGKTGLELGMERLSEFYAQERHGCQEN